MILAGQVCYSCAEFTSGEPEAADMHDETWLTSGRESLRRLRELSPAVAHFSHDATAYRSETT